MCPYWYIHLYSGCPMDSFMLYNYTKNITNIIIQGAVPGGSAKMTRSALLINGAVIEDRIGRVK